ncbi:hypothetical protein DAD186_14440 [Dermabacter vaginalis]|uniref:Colicin transporter n=1 Tax=Dermabacter vaginalis TaxID=1630135 RepID=A0A1B0ZJ13_9MICO|nr:hypothetical protein [Dermabacter vaginalis]ANP27994.1 hypothetical protein DAD186_14440 [Dermabacter vaginalis]
MKRTTPIIATAITALALVIGGTGCTSNATAAPTCDSATKSYQTALTAYHDAADTATATLDKARATEGFTLDNNEDAKALTATLEETKADSVPACQGKDDAATIDQHAATLKSATTNLNTSTSALIADLDETVLAAAKDRNSEAAQALTTALDAANTLHDSSADKVADNATRDQLRARIDEAQKTLNATVDTNDPAALDEHTAALHNQLKALNEQKGAVEASQQTKANAQNAQPKSNNSKASSNTNDDASKKATSDSKHSSSTKSTSQKSSSDSKQDSSKKTSSKKSTSDSTKSKSSSKKPSSDSKKSSSKKQSSSKTSKSDSKKSSSKKQSGTKKSTPKKSSGKKKDAPKKSKKPSKGGDSNTTPGFKTPKFEDNYDDRGAPPGCHKDSFGNIYGRDCTGNEIWP